MSIGQTSLTDEDHVMWLIFLQTVIKGQDCVGTVLSKYLQGQLLTSLFYKSLLKITEKNDSVPSLPQGHICVELLDSKRKLFNILYILTSSHFNYLVARPDMKKYSIIILQRRLCEAT